ncbi:RNA polymerase sigma factor [Lacicoccus alkaliphilus]|uniref:RNA polymerase sigma factor, sigma-70 family n=1 Tax=Lacicoccus alkaliphilus DSM 16010 TaxID=1123231 RepID=A0A1M7I2R7_9BACL|nr:sigma-70 family RNA polymerase sigma factor [Salinicoccus alkaliphilus]SHM34929.1 RNA polymerase sigma factor, sigma-70 family [Salinicoccus alkaliphilus DSM 16010]
MYLIAQYRFCIKESLDDEMNRCAYRVSKGDVCAFDWIDDNLRKTVFRKTLKYPFTFHDREDALQEMMELALRLCHKYNPEAGNYRHYVSKVITYEMRKLFYRGTEHQTVEMLRSAEDITFDAGDHRNTVRDNPLDILIDEENRADILNNRKICSPLEREIVHYCNYGYHIKEISERLHVSEKAIMNGLHRVRRKCRK